MAEHDLWHTFRDRMKMHGHLERIENLVGRGRPDVNYCIRSVEGNIELKQIPAWPSRPETVVPIPHYTPQQRIWARQRIAAGGRVYVLLEVVRPIPTYILLRGEWSRVYLAKTATQEDIRRNALVCVEGSFPTPAILRVLTG